MPPVVIHPDSARSVFDTVRRESRRSQGGGVHENIPRFTGGLRVYIAKTGGSGIPALSGSTPGSATVTLYEISGGSLVVHNDADSNPVTVTAYNLSTSAVAADSYFVVDQELYSGELIIIGPAGGGSTGTKPLVRFTLDSDLATTDASKAATITDQWGPGDANSTSITVHNFLISGSTYMFEGTSGTAGLAFHDSGSNYRILIMPCP